jgi:hypothetical protein
MTEIWKASLTILLYSQIKEKLCTRCNGTRRRSKYFDQGLSIDKNHVGCLSNKALVLAALHGDAEAEEYRQLARSLQNSGEKYSGELIYKESIRGASVDAGQLQSPI